MFRLLAKNILSVTALFVFLNGMTGCGKEEAGTEEKVAVPTRQQILDENSQLYRRQEFYNTFYLDFSKTLSWVESSVIHTRQNAGGDSYDTSIAPAFRTLDYLLADWIRVKDKCLAEEQDSDEALVRKNRMLEELDKSRVIRDRMLFSQLKSARAGLKVPENQLEISILDSIIRDLIILDTAKIEIKPDGYWKDPQEKPKGALDAK